MKNIQLSQPPCRYFLEGRCKFGQQCRYSHRVVSCILVRHAESQFNLIVNQSENHIYSEEAKKEYQLDVRLIDCRLTEAGFKQIQGMEITKGLGGKNGGIWVDAIFVSPLQRALYSVQHMMKVHKISCKKVIVLANLTEVVSKICDLSHPISDKIKKFPQFDFSQFIALKNADIDNWQDRYIDEKIKPYIDGSKKAAERYLKAIDNFFPEPLESSEACFSRTLRVLDQIRNICLQQKYQNIILLSHNRILKYISGRFRNGREKSFNNCQIRQILL